MGKIVIKRKLVEEALDQLTAPQPIRRATIELNTNV